jgi:hypothetical protein
MPGDAVFVRVGRMPRRDALGLEAELRDGAPLMAGLGIDCLDWIHQAELSVLGSDAGNDVLASPSDVASLPIHVGCLAYMGLHLIDNVHVEPMARSCRELGRWEFQLSIAPLVFERATGSPVNPIAVF